MINAIFLLVAFYFAFQIWKGRGAHRLQWFFAGILFFPTDIQFVESPQITFPRLLIYVLLIATFIQRRNGLKKFRQFPLKSAIVFLFLMLLAIGIFDENISNFLKIYRPIVYLFDRFFVIYLVYANVRSVSDIEKVYKKLFYFFFAFTIYGVLNYLTKSSPYSDLIYSTYGGVDHVAANMSNSLARFRVASFSWHAIYYGLVLDVVILIYLFYFNFLNKKGRSIFYVSLLLLLLLNLFLVNSRTPILALGAGYGLFYIFSYNLGTKVRLIVLGVTLFVASYSLFPDSFKIVDETIDTFSTKGADVTGSSIEMREIQLAASLVVFQKSPITGNGFEYIHEGLGYSRDKDERRTDEDFAGFESYGYVLLIEQGICGILGNLVFFGAILIFHLKQHKRVNNLGKKIIVLNLSILLTFLLFIFGTGDLGSFVFINSILGLNLKGIMLCRNNIEPEVEATSLNIV